MPLTPARGAPQRPDRPVPKRSPSDSRPLSVAIQFVRLGPYHVARLNTLARRCKLTAVELVALDRTYQWARIEHTRGFDRVTLLPSIPPGGLNGAVVVSRLKRVLAECKPDVYAIPGWGAAGCAAAILCCLSSGVPSLLFSESQLFDRPRSTAKEWIKRRLVRLQSGALVAGSRHIEYLRALGMPVEKIFVGYSVVDNHHFSSGADEVRTGPAARHRLRLPEQFFLSSCRFVPEKNLSRLLTAYARYHQLAGDSAWHLVLLGDGALYSEIRQRIGQLSVANHVFLPGFRQYDELPAYYGLASAFILPSLSEPWGLVVNEAMAAGVPVIVSNRCGCAPELVQEGRNGFTFDPCNEEELAQLMLRISSMREDQRQTMGQAGREIISQWSPETFAENFLKAVEMALSSPPPKPTVTDWRLLHLLMRYRP